MFRNLSGRICPCHTNSAFPSPAGAPKSIWIWNPPLSASFPSTGSRSPPKNGPAKKLLASSALYCYCAALDKALETRSAKYRRIEGKATVRTGTDDKGRGRVTGIDLDVTVFMDQEYEFIFDRVEKIMKQGCLITGSLEAAFPVKYNLNLECDED